MRSKAYVAPTLDHSPQPQPPRGLHLYIQGPGVRGHRTKQEPLLAGSRIPGSPHAPLRAMPAGERGCFRGQLIAVNRFRSGIDSCSGTHNPLMPKPWLHPAQRWS